MPPLLLLTVIGYFSLLHENNQIITERAEGQQNHFYNFIPVLMHKTPLHLAW
jgi:hypothetical protein